MNISPINIWFQGQMLQADQLTLKSIDDNLVNSATFYWYIGNEQNINMQQGNLTMTGADYSTYSSSTNSNQFAYQWAAQQLNLTLI